MSESYALHGLNCPRCGGRVTIPEGQIIVNCPYCDMRSFVRGDRGLRWFQVSVKIERQNAIEMMNRFLSRNWAIARGAARQSEVKDAFLVHLPFWTVWGRVAAWAFGEKKVGSGDRSRYEPREIRIVQEMTWNGAACDVGEFGVSQVTLDGQSLAPYNSDELHANGLVFEPVNSFAQLREQAEGEFQNQVRKKVNLDRIAQLFVRMFSSRYGLVYYPMWVIRYIYQGRVFQVVTDAYSGKVLYGKAPGNTLYRAAVLVVGMAIGALLAVAVPAFLVSVSGGDDGEGILGLALIILVVGFAIMGVSYRAFRYGEEYEYRSSRPKLAGSVENPIEFLSNGMSSIKVKDVEQWINRLS
jgi:DNA-directed RNA polymerase subunit RPC12/RpoP